MVIPQTKIEQALLRVLEGSILGLELVPKGENNLAYKVTTKQGYFLMRIPKHPRAELKNKLEWIENQLKAHNIYHTPLLHFEDSGDFPYGWMMFQFVEGKNGHDAIIDGDVTLEEFHEKLGLLLKQVHQIAVPRFGEINKGQGTHLDFIAHNLEDTKAILDRMDANQIFGRDIYPQVEEAINRLVPLKERLRPVLVHTDAEPANCIWTKDREIVLIDWDNALATTWTVDYAELTYTGSHLSELGSREDRRRRIHSAFLTGYGEIEFTERELETVEHALHVIKAINSLQYYKFVQNNPEWVGKSQERLLSLLSA